MPHYYYLLFWNTFSVKNSLIWKETFLFHRFLFFKFSVKEKEKQSLLIWPFRFIAWPAQNNRTMWSSSVALFTNTLPRIDSKSCHSCCVSPLYEFYSKKCPTFLYFYIDRPYVQHTTMPSLLKSNDTTTQIGVQSVQKWVPFSFLSFSLCVWKNEEQSNTSNRNGFPVLSRTPSNGDALSRLNVTMIGSVNFKWPESFVSVHTHSGQSFQRLCPGRPGFFSFFSDRNRQLIFLFSFPSCTFTT